MNTALAMKERISRLSGKKRSLFEYIVSSLPAAAPEKSRTSPVVGLRTGGSRPPVFCIHPVGGDIACYLPLAALLKANSPVYGLQSPALNETDENGKLLDNLDDICDCYLTAVQTVQPRGPYQFCGWSFGGLIAFEMARKATASGEKVRLLAVIDSLSPGDLHVHEKMDDRTIVKALARDLSGMSGKEIGITGEQLVSLPADEQLRVLLTRAQSAGILPKDVRVNQVHRMLDVFKANARAKYTYRAEPYEGDMILFNAGNNPANKNADASLGWEAFVKGRLTRHIVGADHFGIMKEPQVHGLVEKLNRYLD